ncbi:MAG: adenine deaminase [Candidatus Bathyarchaeia archaeon]
MVSKLQDVTKLLVDTALGRIKADLVIKNGNLINVNSGEILEGFGIAIKGDRIATIGEIEHTVGPETIIIDAKGKYAAPGFIDAHVHVESSMMNLTEFSRTVLMRGTTTVFIDPHEIANVLGIEGVRLMLKESKQLPLKVFITAPSCVPANPILETSGAYLGPKEVEEMLSWDNVIALGEMMNYPGVLLCDDEVHEKISIAHRIKKLIEGHDAGLLGKELAAYASAGITSSHEMTKKIDAVERIRLGMYAYMREGSAWLDVAETVKAITELKLDSRHACLVTDDREPDSLIKQGHMDHVIRRAIEEGLDPIKAIQMATLNPAEHYGLAKELGSIAPARIADIVIMNRLTKVDVETVIANGKIVLKEKKFLIDFPKPDYPKEFLKTIKVKTLLSPKNFEIKAPINEGEIKVRVIGAIEGNVLTEHLIESLSVENGLVKPDFNKWIYKLAVVERHKATGNIGLGFVKGFGFKIGAIASSIAHDSHNILILGLDDEDMAVAANKLIEAGGGIITIKDKAIISFLELPLAGLMSIKPVEIVAKKLEEIYESWKSLGCKWVSPFMTISLLALDVLPKLRLTDKGLIDTEKFKIVDLFPEKPK